MRRRRKRRNYITSPRTKEIQISISKPLLFLDFSAKVLNEFSIALSNF